MTVQITDSDIIRVATAAAQAEGQELDAWIADAILVAAQSKKQKRKIALHLVQEAQAELFRFLMKCGCTDMVALARASDFNIVAISIEVDARLEREGRA